MQQPRSNLDKCNETFHHMSYVIFSQLQLEVAIQDAFLRFMATILKGYEWVKHSFLMKHYLKKLKQTKMKVSYPDVNVLFKNAAIKNSIGRNHRRQISVLFNTKLLRFSLSFSSSKDNIHKRGSFSKETVVLRLLGGGVRGVTTR